MKKVYFIGIGGIAMSATACLARDKGYEVSGSDFGVYSPSLDVLLEGNIDFTNEYTQSHIELFDPEIVVATAAQHEDNPQIAWWLSRGHQLTSLPEFLYQLFEGSQRIVVSGTHGKSTTTGMLGHTLAQINNSSFMAGAVDIFSHKNFHSGDGDAVVFEGDEYKALYDDLTPKFHYLKPDVLVLTNLEYDHPDIFASLDEIAREYGELISSMPPGSTLVYNADDIELVKLAHRAHINTFSYAVSYPSNFLLDSVNYHEHGTTIRVRVNYKDTASLEAYELQTYGEINVYNALATIATLHVLGYGAELIAAHLQSFEGMKRRFEIIKDTDKHLVIDDYAHHPTAVQKTIEVARQHFPDRRLIVVFEPHTFSRTLATKSELINALKSADLSILAEIYPARERKQYDLINSKMLISESGSEKLLYATNKSEARLLLHDVSQPGDVIIVMAVGDFNLLAYEL